MSMSDRYDPTTDPLVLAELAGPYDPEAHLRIIPEPAIQPDRLYVLPTSEPPTTADLEHAVEVRGISDLRLSDDERPVTQLAKLGILNAEDMATLRRMSGLESLAEWCAGPKLTPWRAPSSLALRMAARLKAVQDVRLLIRLCPEAYLPAVRHDG